MRFLKYVLMLAVAAVFANPADHPDFLAGKSALEDGIFDVAEKRISAYFAVQKQWSPELEEGAILYLRALHGLRKYNEIRAILKSQKLLHLSISMQPSFIYMHALAEYDTGNASKAIELLKSQDGKFGGEWEWRALRLLAGSYMKAGDYKSALTPYKLFDERFRNTAEGDINTLQYADCLVKLGRHDEALKVLSRFDGKTSDPAAFEAQCFAAAIRMEKGEFSKALATLQVLTNAPSFSADAFAKMWFLIASAYEGMTNIDMSISAMTNGFAQGASRDTHKAGRIQHGHLLLKFGKIEEGVKVLRELVTEYPQDEGSADLQLEIGQVMLNADRNEEAAKEFQYFLETFTNAVGTAKAYFGKGLSLLNLDRSSEAAGAFGKAATVAEDPKLKEDAFFMEAESFFENKQYGPAAECYERFVKEFSSSKQIARATLRAGESRWKQGNKAASETMFVAATKTEASVAEEAFLRLGELKYAEGDWKSATNYLGSLIANYPKSKWLAEARHIRGLSVYKLGDYVAALSDFTAVASMNKTNPAVEHANFEKGVILYRLGREKDALESFSQFSKAYPNSRFSPEVQFWQAEHEYNLGDRVKSEDLFLDVAEKYPSNSLAPRAILRSGMAKSERKEYLKAIELFSRIAKDYPKSELVPDARHEQANALMELGRFADAIVLFDDIINKWPQHELVLSAWGRKGDCQFMLGKDDPRRYEESIRSYELVAGDAHVTIGIVLQAWYKIGRVMEKQNKRKDALDIYYSKVMIPYLDSKQKGERLDEDARLWFTRAAFGAADLVAGEKDLKKEINILERVVEAEVPSSEEARARIKKLKGEPK